MREATRIRLLVIPVLACCGLPVACAAQTAVAPQSIEAQFQGPFLLVVNFRIW